jgi:hypothetical protein
VRGRVSALLAVMLLAACASTPPAAPSDPSAPIPTVDPRASADPALVAKFMDEGLSEGQAIFAALTRVDVQQLTPLSYRITQSYPTGNNAEFTVTLTPDQTVDSDAPMTATYTATGGDFGFRLEYFIAYDDIPDDVEAEIRGPSAGTNVPIRLADTGLGALALTAAEKSGIRVVVEGLVKELADAAASAFAEALDQALGLKAGVDSLLNALKAGVSVDEALALRKEHGELMAKIDKLEECAKNPTNPVTKRAYQADPAQRQKILNTIAEARLEIKSNFAAIFVGMVNTTGSGLTGSKVLGFVLGPATAYLEQELKKLNDGWIMVLEQLITPCVAYQFSGARLQYWTFVQAEGIRIEVTVTEDWKGVVCGDPLEAEWQLSVDATGVFSDGDVDTSAESVRIPVTTSPETTEIGELGAKVTYLPREKSVRVEPALDVGLHELRIGSATVPLLPLTDCPLD